MRDLLITFLLFQLAALSALTAEVDQFTRRSQIPADSLKVLDQELNGRIKFALENANSGIIGSLGRTKCGSEDHQRAREELFTELRAILVSRSPIGLLEKYAEKTNSVQKRKIALEDSIYKEAAQNSKILKQHGLSSVITINGIQIGTDKLGHFLSDGYSLYYSSFNQRDDKTRRRAYILDGHRDESRFAGMYTTGVKSYADISANLSGALFWERLCGRPSSDSKSEVIEYFKKNKCLPNAYLKCEDSKWVLNPDQKITLKDYVNSAWDETINCSSFDSVVSDEVVSRMASTVVKEKRNQPCPVEPAKCVEAFKSYSRTLAHGVLNPICFEIAEKIQKNQKLDTTIKFNYEFNPSAIGKKKKTTDKPPAVKSQN